MCTTMQIGTVLLTAVSLVRPDLRAQDSIRPPVRSVSQPGLQVADPPLPGSAPTNLTGSANATEAYLNWTPAPGAARYTLCRSPSAAATCTPTDWRVQVLSYRAQDFGLLPGRTYWYTVTAIQPDGRVGSAQTSVTTEPPKNPENFRIETQPWGKVSLEWNSNPGARYVWLQGTGIPPQKIEGTSSFTLSGPPPTPYEYSIISYYADLTTGEVAGDEARPTRLSSPPPTQPLPRLILKAVPGAASGTRQSVTVIARDAATNAGVNGTVTISQIRTSSVSGATGSPLSFLPCRVFNPATRGREPAPCTARVAVAGYPVATIEVGE